MRAGSTRLRGLGQEDRRPKARAHERKAELTGVGALPRDGQDHQTGHLPEPAQLAAAAAHVDDGLLGSGEGAGRHHGHAIQRMSSAQAALVQGSKAAGKRAAALRVLPARPRRCPPRGAPEYALRA